VVGLGPNPALVLVHEDNRLHAGYVETLAATQVFAHHDIVFAQHVGTGLGKTRAITFIGTAGQLTLFGAHQPHDIVFRTLVAVRAIQVCRLLFGTFVKKITFFHTICDYCTFIGSMWISEN
jgi:hypothetical protein